MNEEILSLLNQIESENSALTKKKLISQLGQIDNSDEVFEALKSLYFKEKSDSLKAHIISTIASLQDIKHLDFLRECFENGKTIIRRNILKCIWLYDIYDRINYCKENIDDEEKIPFILEILKGIDQKESLKILDAISKRYPQYRELALKYKNYLWDKIKKYYPLHQRNPLLFYSSIVGTILILTIGAYFLFSSKKDKNLTLAKSQPVKKETDIKSNNPKTTISHPQKPTATERTKTETKKIPSKSSDTKENSKKPALTPRTLLKALIKIIKKDEDKAYLLIKKYRSLLLQKKKQFFSLLKTFPDEFFSKYGEKLYSLFPLKEIQKEDPALLIKFYPYLNKKEKQKLLVAIFSHPQTKLDDILNLKTDITPQPLYLLKTEGEKLENLFYNITKGDYLTALKIYKKLSAENQKKLSHLKIKIIDKIKTHIFLENPLQYFAFVFTKKNFSSSQDFTLWKKLILLFNSDKLKLLEKKLKQLHFKPQELKYLILGSFYYQKMNDFKNALRYLIKYSYQDPENMLVKILIGRCYLNVNFLDEARKIFEEVLSRSQDPLLKKIASQHITFIDSLNETF